MKSGISRRELTLALPGTFPLVVEWKWLAVSSISALVFPFFAIPSVLALLVHELGHAAVATALGARVCRIELRSLHGLCVFEGGETPEVRLRVALAGPVVEFVFVLLLGALCEGLRLSIEVSHSLDTVLFLAARFSWTVLALHAVANLVPGIHFAGRDTMLGTDGLAAAQAWKSLRSQKQPAIGKSAVTSMRLACSLPPGHWAELIMRAHSGEIAAGRCIGGNGVSVLRLKTRGGFTAGACCDIAVRDPKIEWPDGLPLTSIVVKPWSPVAAVVTWFGGALVGFVSALLIWKTTTLGFRPSLLFGGLAFALATLLLDKLRIGTNREKSRQFSADLWATCERVRSELRV